MYSSYRHVNDRDNKLIIRQIDKLANSSAWSSNNISNDIIYSRSDNKSALFEDDVTIHDNIDYFNPDINRSLR